jgi:thiosulfate/3-mercaptopyruvate sulfurtransferase
MLTEVNDLMKHKDQYIIVDTRPSEQFVKGHIPGAFRMNFYDFILESTDPKGIEKLNEFLEDALALLTQYNDKTIVFYEEQTGMRAARALWFLNFAGGNNGSVLHGGIQAWVAEGGKLQSGNLPTVSGKERYPVCNNTSILATYADVVENIKNERTVIIDSRSLNEYMGLNVDKCCMVKGRIPNAVNLNWERLVNKSGKFLEKEEILKKAHGLGITPEKQVIVYCHRGARSANIALALQSAGFKNVQNYIGSWHEWTRKEGAPIYKT